VGEGIGGVKMKTVNFISSLEINSMKIVKVTYTAKAEYAEQNQANIKNVMADLQKLNHPGINYNSCIGADGKSFIHTAFFNSVEDEKILMELPAFIHFQQQLKANGLEAPPKQELLSLVGSSCDIFRA
jgi:hypothetical protein